jgi:hypothetical protein
LALIGAKTDHKGYFGTSRAVLAPILNAILFIYFIFILQDLPHQTNIKLIQISTSALAGTDHRDKLQ